AVVASVGLLMCAGHVAPTASHMQRAQVAAMARLCSTEQQNSMAELMSCLEDVARRLDRLEKQQASHGPAKAVKPTAFTHPPQALSLPFPLPAHPSAPLAWGMNHLISLPPPAVA